MASFSRFQIIYDKMGLQNENPRAKLLGERFAKSTAVSAALVGLVSALTDENSTEAKTTEQKLAGCLLRIDLKSIQKQILQMEKEHNKKKGMFGKKFNKKTALKKFSGTEYLTDQSKATARAKRATAAIKNVMKASTKSKEIYFSEFFDKSEIRKYESKVKENLEGGMDVEIVARISGNHLGYKHPVDFPLDDWAAPVIAKFRSEDSKTVQRRIKGFENSILKKIDAGEIKTKRGLTQAIEKATKQEFRNKAKVDLPREFMINCLSRLERKGNSQKGLALRANQNRQKAGKGDPAQRQGNDKARGGRAPDKSMKKIEKHLRRSIESGKVQKKEKLNVAIESLMKQEFGADHGFKMEKETLTSLFQAMETGRAKKNKGAQAGGNASKKDSVNRGDSKMPTISDVKGVNWKKVVKDNKLGISEKKLKDIAMLYVRSPKRPAAAESAAKSALESVKTSGDMKKNVKRVIKAVSGAMGG